MTAQTPTLHAAQRPITPYRASHARLKASPPGMRCALAVLLATALSACQTVPRLAVDNPSAPLQPGIALGQAAPVMTEAVGVARPASPPGTVPLPASQTDLAVQTIQLARSSVGADLWGRMQRGFAVPSLTHELVDRHARRFASKGFLQVRADRVRLYLPMIVEELEGRNMPLELALLPLVESALNPQARSPVGALGLWQFMAPTANRFELRTSRLVDDRKNLREATRAAMDYLGKLHAQFGDWHLAMAAYNWGEGRVAKAVARNRAAGLPTDFNALAASMPAETRNYVPQIMALAALVANPAEFGYSLPTMPDGNPLTEVEITRDIDLSLVLRMAALSEREFLALNPAIKPPLILAAATPRLLLPQDASTRLERALAAHTGKTASWTVHTLAATQPLETLAARHGASVSALREANGIPAGMKPVAGSALLLPVAAAPGSQTHAQVVASAQLNTTPDVVQVYTQARAKETPADVARRSGVALAQLAQWNGFAGKRLSQRLPVGKVLSVWVMRGREGGFLASAPVGRVVVQAKTSKKPT